MSASSANGADTGRRRLLGRGLLAAMWVSLLASYGVFAGYAGRFLFPSRRETSNWKFVCDVGRFRPGTARRFQSPEGAGITVARQGTGIDGTQDFVALSSVCPHLGCQVHWEGHNSRFFCPCHNGVFAPNGTAVSGPPAEAGQDLARYPLKVESGLLYIDVPVADGLVWQEIDDPADGTEA